VRTIANFYSFVHVNECLLLWNWRLCFWKFLDSSKFRFRTFLNKLLNHKGKTPAISIFNAFSWYFYSQKWSSQCLQTVPQSLIAVFVSIRSWMEKSNVTTFQETLELFNYCNFSHSCYQTRLEASVFESSVRWISIRCNFNSSNYCFLETWKIDRKLNLDLWLSLPRPKVKLFSKPTMLPFNFLQVSINI
jgi:hypothetical protein